MRADEHTDGAGPDTDTEADAIDGVVGNHAPLAGRSSSIMRARLAVRLTCPFFSSTLRMRTGLPLLLRPMISLISRIVGM